MLAIPAKRTGRETVSYLTTPEVEALLAAPDRSSRLGRRDHALLVLAVQTGLRVSELVGLRCADFALGPGAHVSCRGKGRKQRSTPLAPDAVAVLRAWAKERAGQPGDPLFPGPRGKPLSRDAIRRVVDRHVATAAAACPSLATKSVSPHTLRHTCAMQLLEAGVDPAVIALWLGHESIRTTDIYQHADLAMKQRALDRLAPGKASLGRYRPSDRLLAFLESL